MKKKCNSGFMLAETLIVTLFVATVLLFMFIQFSNLSKTYNESYTYNSVEDLYSLKNVKTYIENDSNALSYIKTNVTYKKKLDISNCEIFTDKEYCLKLFELEQIDKIIVTTNKVNYDLFKNYKTKFKKFINKIGKQGEQKYRIIASFNKETFATIRFGD